ncbi:MAG: type II secretion system protein GspE [Deltaproteobacteria bacterium]|nr:MAG: type II secretion system protein GspE [Deltaproteobacteria bacterium]
MFRKEFVEIISQTGMVPLSDLRPLLKDKNPADITELKLIDFSFFDDVKFAQQVAEKSKMTYMDLSDAKVEDNILQIIKKTDVIKFRALPIQRSGEGITFAVYDPSIMELKKELQTLVQQNVELVVTNMGAWKSLYERITESIDEILLTIREIGQETEKDEDISEEDISEDVVTFVNKILAESFLRKASDIHIEPYEKVFRIRFRVDGTLIVAHTPPRNIMLPLISRIKIMAQMDISEKRKPQDGRIKLGIANKSIDYRVSSLPTLFGEKIVMRLLDPESLQLDMTKLGLAESQFKIIKENIHMPFGMCLVTGPTGSGKTTTLYSALADLNRTTKNISTAEDPVEFNMEGINQVNIRREAGLTFASALKAFLRQDPDIIMVGEIRDLEVGEIAIEAALTGHMVLSTLHTNDAPSTITRLLNMGIEPFLVTGALNIVVAQRLCRRICVDCKIPDEAVGVEALIAVGLATASAQSIKPFKGKGCEICNETGYKGRVAIYEVMRMSPAIKALILRDAPSDELKKQAIREGMKTLRMSALGKFAQGITTLEEVVANSSPDKFS